MFSRYASNNFLIEEGFVGLVNKCYWDVIKKTTIYISENRLYVYAYTRDELLKADNLLVFINLQFFSFFKFYQLYVEI